MEYDTIEDVEKEIFCERSEMNFANQIHWSFWSLTIVLLEVYLSVRMLISFVPSYLTFVLETRKPNRSAKIDAVLRL